MSALEINRGKNTTLFVRNRVFGLAFLALFLFAFAVNVQGQVITGLDVLEHENFKPLLHKHVGLIANQTSRTRDGKFGPALFKNAKGVKLVALFAPEHGLMGTRVAGNTSDAIEHYESIPVYSLYGSTRKPTKAMLKGIDVLVFDLQDIGVRPYTYLSTMILSMEAANENHIPFVVLDRPNPLSGTRIEGNILEMKLQSFVGELPIPYLHGMTLGELAKMAVGESWILNAKSLKLSVIASSGWKRPMYWNETGLPWTSPSPNIPHFENAIGAAMLGALGELGIISIGIGGEKPFLALGSNLVKSDALLRVAQAAFPHPIVWEKDSFSAIVNSSKKNFAGITVTLPRDLHHAGTFYPAQFAFLSTVLHDSAMRTAFDGISTERILMFQKVTGTTVLSSAFEKSRDVQPILDGWSKDVDSFALKRKKYLLYQ
jgi:uncharacterized protein YbbC (DUF1343 family)